jgi:hypothetical protein
MVAQAQEALGLTLLTYPARYLPAPKLKARGSSLVPIAVEPRDGLRRNDPRDPAATAALALLGSLTVLINPQLALICPSKSHTRDH